jgi:thiamine-phosphate pyrophosphorylase
MSKFDVKKAMLLYSVTDRARPDRQALIRQIEASLIGGVTCLQLREKNLPFDEFLAEAIEVKRLCERYDVPFIVNDNVEIAMRSNADGVHVGQSDISASEVRRLIGDDKILGVSAYTAAQSVLAERQGADYLGVGAVFATSTKPDANYVSRETLCEIRGAVKIPIVAIGGINRANIHDLRGSGIDGVALASAIYGAKDISRACREMRLLSKETVKCREDSEL